MVDLTYRGLGPWGPGKGANLQAAEVDNNFWAIATAIVDIVNNPAAPNGIASIAVSGTQMTITLTNGDVMGPFTLPVLTFRWRDEWQPNTPYAELDVFKVTDLGIYAVEFPHTSGTTFDPNIEVAGEPALLQLFGSADARLSQLSDVQITALADGDFLHWVDADQKWENLPLGSMALQNADAVFITGGQITGMPAPIDPSDVANKAYVDALPMGMSVPDATMMSNVGGSSGPALPNTLSDFLDYVLGTTVRGTLIYRSGSGWIALPPGAPGNYLQTGGSGVDPTWGPGSSGITILYGGTGISESPSPIAGSSGTISLANIPDSQFLGNISGATAAPVPVTISQFLDHALSSSRGTLLTRTSGGWVALAPGTSGLFLKTQGSGADLVWDSPAGAGTVLSVGSGTGLTGGPITSTGTLALAAIADANLLANISGASAAPGGITLSQLLDKVLGTSRGAVMYRGSAAWVALAPGTSGQILTTGGASADPSWQNAPITGSSVPNNRIVSNISGSSAVPAANTLTNIFDAILSSARGSLIYRTNSGWVALAPGSSGQVLQSGGGSGDPSWATNGGGLISITSPQPQDVLSYNSSSGRFENVRPKYNIGAYVAGTMIPAQNLLFHKFSKAVTLPANLGAYLGHTSEAGAASAATASTAITLARAAVSTPTTFTTVATITFAAGAVVGTSSVQSAIAFAQGDVLRVRGPTTPDATLADFFMTLVGWET